MKYGIESAGFTTDFQFFNSVGRSINQRENTTQPSAYVDFTVNKGLWVINPSFRAQYYASLNNFSPEPRLGIKYNLSQIFRLKASAGIYSQNLISANSDRDVVNLFTDSFQDRTICRTNWFYLTAQPKTYPPNSKSKSCYSRFELDISKSITMNVEGYYKWFTQLTNLNRNKIFEDNSVNASRPDILKAITS